MTTDTTDAVHELLQPGRTLGTLAPLSGTSAPGAATPSFDPAPPRYELGSCLGHGGFGSVHAAWDRTLERTVALKVLHPHLRLDPAFQQRFLTEARLGARLEHPSIVPVHDLGTLPDGRLAFTMPVIDGRTLAAACHVPGSEVPPLQRTVSWLLVVARAVAYAHDHGVVHRDLKPSNIMIGDYGEVRVLDWGIAASTGDGVGRSGTPAYMAPEQAEGAAAGPPADVYALGRILDGLLALGGDDPDLRELVGETLRTAPTARPTMTQAAERLQAWVDGALRRERALALLADAEPHRRAAHAATTRADARRAEARRLRHTLGPEADKRSLWQLEDEAHAARIEAAQHDGRYVQALHTALAHDPMLPEAHRALRDHALARFRAAEAHGDAVRLATLRAELQAHDLEGVLAGFLQGDGRLTLHTSLPATVHVDRYVEVDRRLVLEPVCTDLPSPVDLPLPMGSYRCRIEAPGRATTLYPFHIQRQRHWQGGPDGARDGTVWLPDALPEGTCYVPAGPYEAGTSPESFHPIPRGLRWLDGFVIDIFPVTNERYLAFLNDLVEQGDVAQAVARAPSLAGGAPVYHREPSGRFQLGLDADGHAWEPDMPVVLICWDDAAAFASWRGARTGEPWRLPTEEEWRKAARGVDGRPYPWGHHLEPGWARHLGSGSGVGPTSIDDHPIDEGPYGLRHAAGQVSCWLADRFDAAGDGTERRFLGGSAWSTAPRFVALDQRGAWDATERTYQIGFRLACDANKLRPRKPQGPPDADQV